MVARGKNRFDHEKSIELFQLICRCILILNFIFYIVTLAAVIGDCYNKI